jgi:murein DD-endopeptidase MepM/ murein hydrolase activator NlpD
MGCRPLFLLIPPLAAATLASVHPVAGAPRAQAVLPEAGALPIPVTPVLRIAPLRPRQGQAIFVSTAGVPQEEPVIMTWDGKRYAIYPVGAEWRGVIPLKIEERPGAHTVRVKYRATDGSTRTVERAVSVGRAPLRVQRLKMSRSTEKLYSHPGRAQELATVRRALRTQTSRQQWDGDFMVPTKGRFSTPFGVKRIRNGRHVGYHRGLDIAAATGTPIRSAAAGRVVLSRSLKMHGKTVVIDHGLGVTSLYIHQSALRCREGQAVRRGDLIGEVGMTGTATGPHLHWSIYVHGSAVSPLFWTKLPR